MEKTIRDLCKRVAATRGFDIDNDSIVQYQDLIGHATEEENAEIANTPELMESFYNIYGCAYGTTSAIKYYVAHSEKILDMQSGMEVYKADAKKFYDQVQELKGTIETKDKAIKELHRDMDGTLKGMDELKAALSMKDMEIVQLKAKLYDLERKEA